MVLKSGIRATCVAGLKGQGPDRSSGGNYEFRFPSGPALAGHKQRVSVSRPTSPMTSYESACVDATLI